MKNKEAYICLHLSVLLFGSAGIFARFLNYPSVIIVSARILFAFLVLAIFTYFKKDFRFINKKDLIKFILSGSILAFHWFAFFQAIKILNVSAGLLLFSSYPLFTAIIDKYLFKNSLNKIFILALFLNLFGLYFISLRFSFNSINFYGYLWGLLSGLSFAVLSFINKSLVSKYPANLVSLYQFAFALIWILPFNPSMTNYSFSLLEICLLILLGVIFTAISHTLFINSFKQINLKTASLITTLEPVYGLILASLFFGDEYHIYLLFGAILIILSTMLETFRNLYIKQKN